jgi:DNA-binding CsgD family transcriptional regulator
VKIRGRPRHPDILTPRQWQVLELVQLGLTNEEIAERLGVTLSSVKFHVSEILVRLGVNSRYEAAAWRAEPQPASRGWALALAPLALFVKLKWSIGAYVATAAGVVVVVAGSVLLAWGLTRTHASPSDAAAAALTPYPADCAPLLTCTQGSPGKHPPGSIRSPGVALGPQITASEAVAQLPGMADVAHIPVAADGDWILLDNGPGVHRPGDVSSFALWNALTGKTRPAWTTPTGMVDTLRGESGDWLAFVRYGGTAPKEWSLMLYNMATGEARQIAAADPAITPQIQCPGCVDGAQEEFFYPPQAAVAGTHVIWPEFFVDGTGAVRERMQMYDITSGAVSTLAEVDPRVEVLEHPAAGGNAIAWLVHRSSGPEQIVVRDLATGGTRTLPVGGRIVGVALSGDGRYLSWDADGFAKYAYDLSAGELVQYASNEGSGASAAGNFVSWQPEFGLVVNAPEPRSGFYDVAKHQVRFVASEPDTFVENSGLLGNWFVWSEAPVPSTNSTPDHGPGGEDEIFYFLRVTQ